MVIIYSKSPCNIGFKDYSCLLAKDCSTEIKGSFWLPKPFPDIYLFYKEKLKTNSLWSFIVLKTTNDHDRFFKKLF